jgi:hypothetical protein
MGCCCSESKDDDDDDKKTASTELAEVIFTISRAMSAPSIDVEGLKVSGSSKSTMTIRDPQWLEQCETSI